MDPRNKEKCEKTYLENGIQDIVQLVDRGVGAENTIVTLLEDSIGTSGSQVGNGGVLAHITKIDDVVGDEKVTYIKMDVEGNELDALKGARNTIIRNQPRLAICIYHLENDQVDIPNYILSLNPNYRFVVRHYTTYYWETVLYAYVKQ